MIGRPMPRSAAAFAVAVGLLNVQAKTVATALADLRVEDRRDGTSVGNLVAYSEVYRHGCGRGGDRGEGHGRGHYGRGHRGYG